MIKKINVDDLQVGMFVADFNVAWMEHPFLSSTKLLKNAKEIDLIRQHNIQEVYIDTSKGKDSAKAVSVGEAQAEVESAMQTDVLEGKLSPIPPGTKGEEGTPFAVELERAKEVYSEAKALVKDLLQNARMGRAVDGEGAARVVDNMVDSIFRNGDALSSLSRLKSYDDYTFQHSLNVSVLALTLGRHLGLVKGELRRLGIGSLLHDVGKMRVPEAILNKPGRLTDEEFAVIKNHSLHGAKILMQTEEIPDECAAVALNHHERFNGRGYPRGLEGLAIGKFGLISAIVDVYDAITSDRVYHQGMPTYQAMQKIYEWGKTDFYPVYVQKFVQCVGIYPIGSVVSLDTGETAVVARQNRDQLLRPWVKVVRGADGAPLAQPFEADLTDLDTLGRREYLRSIASALDPASCGVDVEAALREETGKEVA